MQALRWDGATLSCVSGPDPVPAAGEAVVQVRLAGICRTDLEITRGYLPFRGTLGHEWVGDVIASDDPALAGCRVVGEINFPCRACQTCRDGLPRHCPNRRVMGIDGVDGAFADRVVMPAANLHRVPDTVADIEAVFVEPLAAAFQVLEQVGPVAGRRAVVLGDGKLGILLAQVLAAAEARVSLAGRHAGKLARARALGVNVDTPERGADIVVDASGTPSGLPAALDIVRPRGTVVLKTTVDAAHHLDLAPAVVNEITIVGSRCGPFEPALAALATGRIAVAPLVDAVFPLGAGRAAFARAAEPGTFKILLEPGR